LVSVGNVFLAQQASPGAHYYFGRGKSMVGGACGAAEFFYVG
jgi:hypothetical protein